VDQALPRQGDKIPSMLTAGAYSSVNHYLKAVQAAGSLL
jgi:branched-chain amino acid transport system substrate-binding protein